MKAGIISPSGLISGMADIQKGIDYLENIGYEVVLGNNIFSTYRFMAGTDSQRAADVMDVFSNKEIDIIFCTRGGSGLSRIFPWLDFDVIKNNPKPVVGFSDITALQNAIYAKTKGEGYSGFMLKYNFWDKELGQKTESSLSALLSNKLFEINEGSTVIGGEAEGILVGGCFSIFVSLFGTEYMPDLTDKIVFLEDIGEQTYKIDRMLTQLRQQANFDKVKGIIFGSFTSCNMADPEDGTLDDIIADFAKDLNIPIIKDVSYGHTPNGYVLPIGKKIKLDATNCKIEY